MLAVPLALLAGGSYFWLTGGRFEDTENASLRQAKLAISSEAAGRIVEVDVADNATVRKGDVLFIVDPEPYRIALAQADAALSAARIQVEQLRAGYSQSVAQEQVAAGELDYARAQFERSKDLDDFKLMMIITLCAIPLSLLLRKPSQAAPATSAAHMD